MVAECSGKFSWCILYSSFALGVHGIGHTDTQSPTKFKISTTEISMETLGQADSASRAKTRCQI